MDAENTNTDVGAMGGSTPQDSAAQASQAQAGDILQGGDTQSNSGSAGGEGQTFERPSHMDGFPNDFKQDEVFYQYQNMTELLTAMKELKGKEQAVTVPGENATSEEKAAYYKALGIPESPDGYKLERPANLPSDVKWDEGASAGIAELAHSLSLPPDKASALANWITDQAVQAQDSINKAQNEMVSKNTAALKDAWKNEYSANVQIANDVMHKVLGQEGLDALKAEGIDKQFKNSPTIIQMLHSMKAAFVQDSAMPTGIFSSADKDEGRYHPVTGEPQLDYSSLRGK